MVVGFGQVVGQHERIGHLDQYLLGQLDKEVLVLLSVELEETEPNEGKVQVTSRLFVQLTGNLRIETKQSL